MEWAIEIFGWYGALAIVGAYFLNSFGLIKTGVFYQALNASGALGIVAVSLNKAAYQPALLNLVWFLIGVIAILRLLLKKGGAA